MDGDMAIRQLGTASMRTMSTMTVVFGFKADTILLTLELSMVHTKLKSTCLTLPQAHQSLRKGD